MHPLPEAINQETHLLSTANSKYWNKDFAAVFYHSMYSLQELAFAQAPRISQCCGISALCDHDVWHQSRHLSCAQVPVRHHVVIPSVQNTHRARLAMKHGSAHDVPSVVCCAVQVANCDSLFKVHSGRSGEAGADILHWIEHIAPAAARRRWQGPKLKFCSYKTQWHGIEPIRCSVSRFYRLWQMEK